jgi:hypothetical protein
MLLGQPERLVPLQIQADLGEGHFNVINAKEVLLTEENLALVMEYAAGGSLTSYVSERWQHAQQTGLFLSEDEARYFFRVRLSLRRLIPGPTWLACARWPAGGGPPCRGGAGLLHWGLSQLLHYAVQRDCRH